MKQNAKKLSETLVKFLADKSESKDVVLMALRRVENYILHRSPF